MKQTCILVLGMHRSGTSALTGVLQYLDIDLGSNLAGAAQDNKKGFFENENSVFKIFYLRITGELAKKWNNAKMQNWAKVLNQLSCLDETSDRIARYIR